MEHELKLAESRRKAAETELRDASGERTKKEITLAQLKMKDLWTIASADPELNRSIETALASLGMPAAIDSLSQFHTTVTQAKTLRRRFIAVAKQVAMNKNRGAMIGLMALILILLPITSWAIHKIMTDHALVTKVEAYVLQFAAFTTAAIAILRPPIRTVGEYISRLEKARIEAQNLIDRKRAERSNDEIKLESEIAVLKARESTQADETSMATARLQELEAKISEIDTGKSFSKFLLSRFEAQDYRKHLGLISMIRSDFEKLGELLKSTPTTTVMPNGVDRIILYIDDLDRCPSERVVQVLEAVHLLLAFELFVVIVGVDPRWVLHSLEQKFPHFSLTNPLENGLEQEAITTPQNYLEKIFQIPFTLRTMDQQAFSNMLTKLMPYVEPSIATPADSTVSFRSNANIQESDSEISSGLQAPTSTRQPVHDETDVEAKTTSQDIAPTEQDFPTSEAPYGESSPIEETKGKPEAKVQEIHRTQPRRLDHISLVIRPWEVSYAERMYPLIITPRAAKRFTNTYRLLKAYLEPNQLGAFEGTEAKPGEFRAAMLLLAVQIRFSRESIAIFSALRTTHGNNLK